jgi:hypothetical protein
MSEHDVIHPITRGSFWIRYLMLTLLLAAVLHGDFLGAQTGERAGSSDSQRMAGIEQRLNEVTATLSQTQQALEQSLLEIQKLRGELDAMKLKTAAGAASPAVAGEVARNEDVKMLHEQQDALQAEIALHEQSKVETGSKYSLRVTGLILFNAFSNSGVVDDADLPTVALPRIPGSSHGSLGATVRQTILGLEATGPHLWKARSSARVSTDFFGGVSTDEYGYSAPTGFLRLREAEADLDWDRTLVQVGNTEPLFTPLSPTSYAFVAEPALSNSGNLWAWSPQVRVEQRIPFSEENRLTLEGGLIDPDSKGYTSVQLDTPVEASRRPGYEGRVAYYAGRGSTGVPRPFVLGLGGYSALQYYNSSTKIRAWAATADWQIPLFKRVELSGEAYRGRALGGFGGGAYKDILTGYNIATGATETRGVEAVGGWSQAKVRFGSIVEANAAWGIDDALSGNFEGLDLSGATNPTEINARNNSWIGNFIFRPKTYLILSPEYRRIQSWLYTGPASTANIFTLTAGYQF